MARIILLNGNSSTGKSSIAKALQEITAEPFLHVAMDAFLDMMPPSLFSGPEGMVFERLTDAGKPSVAIRTGPAAARVLRGMRLAMAALADAGNNLIVDDAMLEGDAAAYAEALSAHHLSWVGVFAPLDVLERRERGRGDRDIGMARGLSGRLHTGIAYDLEVDTAEARPAACAARIKQVFGL